MAGKIEFLVPIDHASGKIFGLGTKFVSTWRALTEHRGCQYRNKKRDYNNNPVTADEEAQHTLFANSAKKVQTIMETQTLRDAWNAQYKADKAAGKDVKATVRGYIFAKCMAGSVTSDNKPVAD